MQFWRTIQGLNPLFCVSIATVLFNWQEYCTFFGRLEKNKDLTTKQMVDELYSLMCNRINDPITYKELKSMKLGLDTKGIIPVQV